MAVSDANLGIVDGGGAGAPVGAGAGFPPNVPPTPLLTEMAGPAGVSVLAPDASGAITVSVAGGYAVGVGGLVSEFWSAFPCAAIDPVGGSDRNFGFGATKSAAIAAGPLRTFREFYRRIWGTCIARPVVYLLNSMVEGTDSTIPPPSIYASDRGDSNPNGITIISVPTVLGTVVLTGGTTPFGVGNNKSIVEATGMSGSWTSSGGQRLTSLFDTQGARFLRSRSSLKTAAILSDLGSKRASIGWPNGADTSLPFATGFRAADFVAGETCDVLGFPTVPDASPGRLPMSYQDIEFSRSDRRNYAAFIISRGNLHMACCATTSTMYVYDANQVLWSGCLTADPFKISSCPNVDIAQHAQLGNGVVTTLDLVTGSSTIGITDWCSQGAVCYFSNGSRGRAGGVARVFDLNAPSLAPFIGAFSADGPTEFGLLFSSVAGAIQGSTWAVISNAMARLYGVDAAAWTGTNTFATQWAALAESGTGYTTGMFGALPFVGDSNHFGAYVGNGFA